MEYLKVFESYSDIRSECEKYGIKNFEIVDDRVNADGIVDLGSKDLSRIPINFGIVSGPFWCNNNKLSSLKGTPKEIRKREDKYPNGGHFGCSYNYLISLIDGPEIVEGVYYCDNNGLKSLAGSPKKVSGEFDCSHNRLMSFDGIPMYSLNENKEFICNDNPVYEIYKLFNTTKCIDPINEYSAIQGNRIIWTRLEEVYHELGINKIPNPEDLDFKYYRLIQ